MLFVSERIVAVIISTSLFYNTFRNRPVLSPNNLREGHDNYTTHTVTSLSNKRIGMPMPNEHDPGSNVTGTGTECHNKTATTLNNVY